MELKDLTCTEKSILLYVETRVVDGGGLFDSQRLTPDDFQALNTLEDKGFLTYGRVPAILLTRDYVSTCTHWVMFTDKAWELAHAVRLARETCSRGPLGFSPIACPDYKLL